MVYLLPKETQTSSFNSTICAESSSKRRRRHLSRSLDSLTKVVKVCSKLATFCSMPGREQSSFVGSPMAKKKKKDYDYGHHTTTATYYMYTELVQPLLRPYWYLQTGLMPTGLSKRRKSTS
eukprot:scpid102023/ scgid24536/ 